MDNTELILKLSALYRTLDAVSVAGFENQSKNVGVGGAIQSIIAELREAEQKKDAAQEAAKKAVEVAAAQMGGKPTAQGGEHGHNN